MTIDEAAIQGTGADLLKLSDMKPSLLPHLSVPTILEEVALLCEVIPWSR